MDDRTTLGGKGTNIVKTYKGYEVGERHDCLHPEGMWHTEVFS